MSEARAAIVRSIPDSFVDAVSSDPRPIKVDKARKQHAAYVRALEGMVDRVVHLDADDAHPDCVFVEDQAVVHRGHALITHVGHPSREGEVGPVRTALTALGLQIHVMEAPATLDGGDVLRVGDTLYVGRSARSNGEGIAMLARVFGPLGFGVVPVPVTNALHLKSVCSSPVGGVVLVAPDTIDPGRFEVPHVIVVPAEEAHACNAVGVGRTAILPGGCHATRAALEELDITIIEVGTSEVRKADGALTCCSILVDL